MQDKHVDRPIKTAKDAKLAAATLAKNKDKYSPAQQKRLKKHIRSHAKRLGATVNLTDVGNNTTGAGQQVPHGQTGKTRAQPRPFGGKFGKKGATSGEGAMPGEQPSLTPDQLEQTINTLQIGQSVSLPGGNAKIKRLGNGYQVVKMDGSVNQVMKEPSEAIKWGVDQLKRHAPAPKNPKEVA